ncbi:Pirin-like protein [Caballeronia choica]|uniref:Pirin-like protein n=1 Tax=Caballeronia choica TaxID=326476 RepID=A0A158G3H3_9BURK|nr:hypothetical protein [Caballeronia choica]SAL26582.1 Pirin-like protein [Caballeronia choica]
MNVVVQFPPSPAVGGGRNVFFRTRGYAHGPVVRMVSSSDVGKMIKPFVFLDFVDTQEAIGQQGLGK